MTTQILLAVLIPNDPQLAQMFAAHLWAWVPMVGLIALGFTAVAVVVSVASGKLAELLDGPEDEDVLEQKRMECVIGFRRGR